MNAQCQYVTFKNLYAKEQSMLTGEQLRAARALVRWEQSQLAESAGISVQTVKRMERQSGGIGANAQTVEDVMQALRRAGVVFLDAGETKDGGPGVRLAG